MGPGGGLGVKWKDGKEGTFESLWVSVTLRVLSGPSGVDGLHSGGSFGVLLQLTGV